MREYYLRCLCESLLNERLREAAIAAADYGEFHAAFIFCFSCFLFFSRRFETMEVDILDFYLRV